MRKFKNGDIVKTIYGDIARILNIGSNNDELTKLDRQICIGFYNDGIKHINQFIVTSDLYKIVAKEK